MTRRRAVRHHAPKAAKAKKPKKAADPYAADKRIAAYTKQFKHPVHTHAAKVKAAHAAKVHAAKPSTKKAVRKATVMSQKRSKSEHVLIV